MAEVWESPFNSQFTLFVLVHKYIFNGFWLLLCENIDIELMMQYIQSLVKYYSQERKKGGTWTFFFWLQEKMDASLRLHPGRPDMMNRWSKYTRACEHTPPPWLQWFSFCLCLCCFAFFFLKKKLSGGCSLVVLIKWRAYDFGRSLFVTYKWFYFLSLLQFVVGNSAYLMMDAFMLWASDGFVWTLDQLFYWLFFWFAACLLKAA